MSEEPFCYQTYLAKATALQAKMDKWRGEQAEKCPARHRYKEAMDFDVPFKCSISGVPCAYDRCFGRYWGGSCVGDG